MNEKTRFQTTLDKSNIRALKLCAITNDQKPSDLFNMAIEQFLENEMVRVKVWLPISFVYFLNNNNIMLETIIREPLAITVRTALEQGKITSEEADDLIELLGFKKGLKEV